MPYQLINKFNREVWVKLPGKMAARRGRHILSWASTSQSMPDLLILQGSCAISRWLSMGISKRITSGCGSTWTVITWGWISNPVSTEVLAKACRPSWEPWIMV
jgi:hypothetical protein